MTSPPAVAPSDLRTAALALGGRVGLVQGAGGNVSAKADGVLWIKASGTRFADADHRPIFIPVDLAVVTELVAVTEDLSAAVLAADGTAGLRPSIETAFHALLPHPFVLHVHAVGAIALSLADEETVTTRLGPLARTVHVAYARPGVPLARVLADRVGDADPASPLIAVLGNHGLVVAGADAAECLGLVERVEAELAAPFLHLLEGPAVEDGARVRRFPPGALRPHQRALLVAGALTPDSAVFLGGRPFSADASDASPGHVDADGAVWLDRALSADAVEIAISLVGVARSADDRTPVRPLGDEQVAELTGWDAEQWRKGQER